MKLSCLHQQATQSILSGSTNYRLPHDKNTFQLFLLNLEHCKQKSLHYSTFITLLITNILQLNY